MYHGTNVGTTPNGALTQLPVEESPPLGVVADLLIPPDGRFFMASGLSSGIAVYTINSDGSLTPVSSPPFPTAGLAEGPEGGCAGKHLSVSWATRTGPRSVHFFLWQGSGKLTKVLGSPFADGNPSGTPSQLAPSRSGNLLFVADDPANHVPLHSTC